MSPIDITKGSALAAAVVFALAFAGCVKRQALEPAWVVPPGCEIMPAPVEAPDTVTVAVFDPVGAGHAPVPGNGAEWLVYGHLFQTLTVLDCSGEVRGALAMSWEKRDGGRQWTFELDPGRKFHDGRPVTAWDVEWWWETTMGDLPRFNAIIDSVAVESESVLVLYFNQKYGDAPRLLASPRFAVAAPSYESPWPVGSGPFERVPDGPGAGRRSLVVRPAFDSSGPAIRFVSAVPGEARDLLDETADAMITSDPDVIDYARTRRRFSIEALPWDRTYVFLSTERVRQLREGTDPPSVRDDVREALAADAVRVEARGHQGTSWWEEAGDCRGDSPSSTPLLDFPHEPLTQELPRVVYDATDPVARGLAERIVALSAAGGKGAPFAPVDSGFAPRPVVATGLDPRELSRSLRYGNDFAYILALPLRVPDPCVEANLFFSTILWLNTLGSSLGEALVPLVDTRPTLIARPGKTGAAVDGFGGVLLYGWTLEGDDLP
jgi:hypothetical protein